MRWSFMYRDDSERREAIGEGGCNSWRKDYSLWMLGLLGFFYRVRGSAGGRGSYYYFGV